MTCLHRAAAGQSGAQSLQRLADQSKRAANFQVRTVEKVITRSCRGEFAAATSTGQLRFSCKTAELMHCVITKYLDTAIMFATA